MELKKDLLEKEKRSIYKIFVGLLFMVFPTIWITDRITDNLTIRPFDWLYAGIFALNGVFHITSGFGISIISLFGKAFIIINNNQISIKPDIFSKEQIINWVDIKTIEYKLNKYIIQRTDNTSFILDLSKLNYALKSDVKNIINTIAMEKNKHASI
ncbi:MAG: hypothetical protein R6U65_01240 [Perlabentimonas sp.]